MAELEKTYTPAAVEAKWYAVWEKNRYFHADENRTGDEPFCIVIPPPNVTGMLTLGHVLNNTIQDILARKKRMEGRTVLWLPGTDHAGIATQSVVERALLAGEKKSRHDLGREEFLDRVWQWKDKYGSTILRQLRMLGCSCDWERTRFTMDEGLSRAVAEAFVRLYEKGVVYRGKYIINWCPRCRTALSDEENEHQEKNGHLWHIRYPRQDGNGYVVVATTRPETMLGDTAVAVNPADERYKGLVGNTVVLPLANRPIPVIADHYVDREFGTGCVKVTPAHDPNDFAMGERHNLEKLVVMNLDGTMNNAVPQKYRGMDRFTCRKAVVEDLNSLGLLEKIQDHSHAVGHCQRCHTVTEPFLSMQWFVKYDQWIQPALAAVEKRELRFYPERWEKTFAHWLENIRDWCISRQLWWGHRIPAWYCVCGHIVVARQVPTECPACKSTDLKQDEDVLDTWFSSWLWPFSTMGWPDETATLSKFYPTNALVTAADIIFFWVARMVFAGMEFMGKLPFSEVFFNSIVRDMQGRKMSKSLGNSPDPIEVINTYGADALRYTIISLAPSGQDVHFATEKCELGRNFANKLWNSARFAMMNFKDQTITAPQKSQLRTEDQWMISRFNQAVKVISRAIDGYDFNAALAAAYHFTWNELCDWYLEFIKPRMAEGADLASRNAALHTLREVLVGTVKLLHPFMPFITEEIYAALREYGVEGAEHLIVARYPVCDDNLIVPNIEARMQFVQDLVVVIRNLRAENNIPPGKKGDVLISAAEEAKQQWIMDLETQIKFLSKTGTLTVTHAAAKPAQSVSAVIAGAEVFLNLEGLVDKAAERAKIMKDLERNDSFLKSVEAKLANEKFMQHASPEVVEKERVKLSTTREKLEKLRANLALFS